MKFLLRIWGMFTTIPYRLFAQWGLVVAAIFGLIASISLVMSIPLYADAVYYQTFQTSIAQEDGDLAFSRPPFAFLFHYYGGWHGNKQWEDLQPLNDYLLNSGAIQLNLPEEQSVRMISTETFTLYPRNATEAYSGEGGLARVSLGFMTDLAEHIQILEGSYPAPAEMDPEQPIEVLLSSNLAEKAGFQVGETYLAYFRVETAGGKIQSNQFPIHFSGIWQPNDVTEDYWISNPVFYNDVLFVPEATFAQRLNAAIPEEVFSAYWYLVLDGSEVNADEVNSLLNRIYALQKKADTLLPNIRLAVSPEDPLREYQTAANLLTVLLYAFSVPIIGLILAFIGLVSRLSVERQRNEIAILRSRGASPSQILTFTIMEGLLLSLIAFLISIPVSMYVSQLIGQTRTFLDFSLGSSLRTSITDTALQVGIVAVMLVLVAMLIPAIGASRLTIITYKQESGRNLRSAWWQRAWLDVLIFIPAAYGTYLLREQGSIAILGEGNTTDLFSNPLLFLVPALGIFALTLFSLRLIHPIMSAIARLAGLSRNAGLTLAARQLARSPRSYHTPLLILILTVSLSSYTASLAYTLDQHLYDQSYYKVGSDIQFTDIGNSGANSSPFATGTADADQAEPSWVFIPVSEYQQLDGVSAATRLGRYPASAVLSNGGRVSGAYLGIDRVDFPQVAFWRDDFAAASLGAIMNDLALNQEGVLVNAQFLEEYGLREGDPLRLNIASYGQSSQLNLRIIGQFELFPTWYPSDGPLFVGNLDYFFAQTGGEFPYRVLLRTEPDITPDQIQSNLSAGLGITVKTISWDAPLPQITAIQAQPQRQGLFGFLFIGFSTAALLTALAFLLYVLFSFRQRFIELGVLRAAGLSIWQMSGYLIWELAFLIVLGGAIGTGLGYWASELFIPFMQIGADPRSLYPPFQVLIAWPSILQIYIMFSGLFGVTLLISVILLRRMRIFQAIKLGETV